MSYVALKHLLADLTLEAVGDPDRAAWVFVARACAELVSPDHPGVHRSACLKRAGMLAAPFGWKPGRRDLARLVEAGLVTSRGDVLMLASAFVPHLDYYRRHTARLLGAIAALRDDAGGKSAAGDAVYIAAVLFNAGLFFECHEWGEGLWKAATGEAREFYHGLVQVAAAFYHYEKQNLHGSRTLLGKAMQRLAPYPDAYLGVDVARLRADLAPWGAHFGGAPRPADPPRIRVRGEIWGSSAGVTG